MSLLRWILELQQLGSEYRVFFCFTLRKCIKYIWKVCKSKSIFDIEYSQVTLHTKKKFSIKDFLSKCDQIHKWSHHLRIWSHLLKKSLMENFISFALSQKTHILVYFTQWLFLLFYPQPVKFFIVYAACQVIF